ncbi:DUF4430 domain-containing protein [Camelliibacillus cellulosilyticus]|uniref:DUF4430 domain-containing protein n=1 Tax=Camelliibacillus cellulosilyticus TaxID=2174486 RepID=A0ABV9GFY0_9BACL
MRFMRLLFLAGLSVLLLIVGACQKDDVGAPQDHKQATTEADHQPKNQPAKKETANKPTNQTAPSEKTEKKSDTPPEKNESGSQQGKEKPSKAEQKKTPIQNKKAASEAKQATKSTPEPKTAKSTKSTTNKTDITVTVSIIGNAEKGTILPATKVSVKKGTTLLAATRTAFSNVVVRGSGASAYVEGIDGLFEFDDGPMSGWIAKKNGKKITRSAGIVSIANGDTIQWLYTTDYTK